MSDFGTRLEETLQPVVKEVMALLREEVLAEIRFGFEEREERSKSCLLEMLAAAGVPASNASWYVLSALTVLIEKKLISVSDMGHPTKEFLFEETTMNLGRSIDLSFAPNDERPIGEALK